MKQKFLVAVCEDDKTQLEYIQSFVSSFAEKERIPCQVEGYVSAEQLLFSFDREMPFDLYILDIQMGEMNGMDLARKIREQDREASILFLTGLREYALEGYEVGAVRYLIKPVKEVELYEILQEIYHQIGKMDKDVFLLECGDGIQKIPYENIWYLEAQGHYVKLAFEKEIIQWKAAFSSFQTLLEENGFVVAKRGLLVNLRRITRIGKNSCILDNGEEIPVSRSQYKKVNEAFIQYYKRG